VCKNKNDTAQKGYAQLIENIKQKMTEGDNHITINDI
jgi:hypothetical protein